jgi:hypothetical protein
LPWVVESICVLAEGSCETHVGRAGFAAGRKPDVGDTNVLVGRHCIVQAVVVLAISRDIPLEALEQSVVLRSGFFCAHDEICLGIREKRRDGNVRKGAMCEPRR